MNGTQPQKRLRIALLASSTVQLFPDLLVGELQSRRIDPDVWTGGFNQYRQEVLDPASPMYDIDPDIVLLHVDGEDLFRDVLENPFAVVGDQGSEVVGGRMGELASLLDAGRKRLPRAGFFVNTIAFPPVNSLTGLEYNSEYSLAELACEYNRRLRALARERAAVAVVDTASVMAWIGYREWHDSRLWYLARSRWSRKAMRALAECYATAICGWAGLARKCIVLDLDNTLWGGIVGEDGPGGIVLAEEGLGLAFVEFQMELLNLHRKGILLAICSKNNPEDALAVIRSHPSMRLKEKHLAAMRINWEDKAANLHAIAGELNVGLDSLVFVDDNPAERSMVAEIVPEVLVPNWPSDPTEYKSALVQLSIREFPKIRITEEDRGRAELYRAQVDRRRLAAESRSLEDYYGSLQMVARIGAADEFTIRRIAQLTQKTNQFNLTTRRYTEPEIAALAASPDAVVWWLELTDRFGSNGIVGVLILRRRAPEVWTVDTFLLSCRVIGRTVEQAFLAHACELLRRRGAARLLGEYRPTERNGLVAALYPRFGFSACSTPAESSGSTFWELELAERVVPMPEWITVMPVEEGAHA
jgi:FkbH-like protein